MLYVTTRNPLDAFTATHAIRSDRAPDGGLFTPFHMPHFDSEQLASLQERTFSQNVALVLNAFFFPRLSAPDVELCIGRNPIRLVEQNRKIMMVEAFGNLDGCFQHLSDSLCARLRVEQTAVATPDWVEIAVRIAILTGVFGELLRTGWIQPGESVDLAAASGTFAAPMAAWYARQMGLPIGTVVCACNENGAAWELLHHGELHTGELAAATDTPECDHAVPPDLERLVFATLGTVETRRFLEDCRRGGTYVLDEEQRETLRRGLFAAVVGRERMENTIRSIYRSGKYLLGPYSALAYCGLSDYRARSGGSPPALLLCERSPDADIEVVARAMRMEAAQLRAQIRREGGAF